MPDSGQEHTTDGDNGFLVIKVMIALVIAGTISSLAVVYKLSKIIDKKALKILCFEHIEYGYLTYSIR